LVTFSKTSGQTAQLLAGVSDYLLWYAKDKSKVKYRQLYREKEIGGQGGSAYSRIELTDGTRKNLTKNEKDNISETPSGTRIYRLDNFTSQRPPGDFPVHFQGKDYKPRKGYWKTHKEGFQRLIYANRVESTGPRIYYVRFIDDFPVFPVSNNWIDTGVAGFASDKRYVVETNTKVIERCVHMTTDPGDIVLDPTCGSGTTAFVSEQWGRRWITCDTSRVAVALAKQRLMTAAFDYYELARPEEGVGSGFRYKTVPHITLKSIANNPEIKEGMSRAQIDAAIQKYADQETLYDQPHVDKKKTRVTGPFTVEAVPSPAVKPLEDIEPDAEQGADSSVARSGETQRQSDWRDELFKTGIRGKGGQRIAFTRVEPLAGTLWLHADAETKEDSPQRAVISFGPEHSPLEQRQVALAIEEAQQIVPKPKIIVFAAFQFDPEAAKDIDETNWPGVTLLKAQMNADLLTEDLKKKRASNESFWLIGQPDIELKRIPKGDDAGKYRVTVNGFDYYNTRTGNIDSGGTEKIAMWMLDPDYDGRSLFPSQVFFPMAGDKEGWSRLAKNLKAEIDENRIEAYRGTVSLPFERGQHRQAAVKIIDDRGIESLKIIRFP
jgi:adenine-specific DNA-methyltransferase